MAAAAGKYAGNQNKNKINKMKVRKISGIIKSFLITVLILAAIIALLWFFLVSKYLCLIENIAISENEKYSYDEILKASGIVTGEELYNIDLKKAKENIKAILTYAETVNITRIFPSTLSIDVKTDKGFFGIMLGGDYYIVSKSFKVIDKIKVVGNGIAESEFDPPEGVITFETNAIKKCYIGEQMEFSDADIYDFLKDIAGLFDSDCDMISMISSIDITNKYKVVMNYSDKFFVRYGIFENITPRILNSFEIIKNLPDYAEGVIDMADIKPASFRYDENVSELYRSRKDKRG